MANALFYAKARTQLRTAARRIGMSARSVRELVEDATDDVIDAAVVEVNATAKVNAIGDGKIIDLIIGFFNSELGKKLIEALLRLLIGGMAESSASGGSE